MSNRRPPWPKPDDEVERVALLHSLAVLDRPPRDDLLGLTRLASYVCGASVAVVNLIDSHRQFQAAAYGAEPEESSRDDSMCAYSILSQDVTYVPDASTDDNFCDNPYVTGAKGNIRLYVAAPLIVSNHVIGTLCAFSPEPGELSRLQMERMRDLADATVRILTLHSSAGYVAWAATRDPLTGLPHRRFLVESMDLSFARRSRSDARPAAVFVDLDGFKDVNDHYGHSVGDTLLTEVTDRLLGAVRASDLVARLGGDEFVVFVEDAGEPVVDLDAEDGLDLLASRIRDALNGPVLLPSGVVELAASVGAARSTGSSDTPGDLLARADAAMYAEKKRRASGARSAKRRRPQ